MKQASSRNSLLYLQLSFTKLLLPFGPDIRLFLMVFAAGMAPDVVRAVVLPISQDLTGEGVIQ